MEIYSVVSDGDGWSVVLSGHKEYAIKKGLSIKEATEIKNYLNSVVDE